MDDDARPNSASNRRANGENERRVDDRFPLVDLTCDRGELLDLSSTGARLQTRWPWRERKLRTLTFSAGQELLSVGARSMWTVREGLFHHTVGVHFEGVTPEQVAMLKKLAHSHGVRTLGLGYSDAA